MENKDALEKADGIVVLLQKEHKERKDIIYKLLSKFEALADNAKVDGGEKELTDLIEAEFDDEDFTEDKDGAEYNTHLLNVLIESIKDLLTVGIKNDELLIKIVDIYYKYNSKSNKANSSNNMNDDDESESSPFEEALLKSELTTK